MGTTKVKNNDYKLDMIAIKHNEQKNTIRFRSPRTRKFF